MIVESYHHVKWGIANRLILPSDDAPNIIHTDNN